VPAFTSVEPPSAAARLDRDSSARSSTRSAEPASLDGDLADVGAHLVRILDEVGSGLTTPGIRAE
jgi:hypothetical protein